MNKASERQKRYDDKNCVRLCLKLNKRTDADVLEWLKKQPSMQGAIKEVIREKISR